MVFCYEVRVASDFDFTLYSSISDNTVECSSALNIFNVIVGYFVEGTSNVYYRRISPPSRRMMFVVRDTSVEPGSGDRYWYPGAPGAGSSGE